MKKIWFFLCLVMTLAFSYTFESLIGEYVDRTLGDRITNGYSFSTPETSENAHPCSDGVGGTICSFDGEDLYKITPEDVVEEYVILEVTNSGTNTTIEFESGEYRSPSATDVGGVVILLEVLEIESDEAYVEVHVYDEDGNLLDVGTLHVGESLNVEIGSTVIVITPVEIGITEGFLRNYEGEIASTAIDFTEVENVWLGGYTANRLEDNYTIQGYINNIIYSAKFTQDEYGLPVCSDSTVSFCDSDEQTENGRATISLIGREWLVVNLIPPSVIADSSTEVYEGGSLRLAQEIIGGVLGVNESLDVGGVVLVVDGVTSSSALISLYEGGTHLYSTEIYEGTTESIVLGSETYVIKVFNVAGTWVDIAFLTEPLELTSGEILYDAVNNTYEVVLGWKNEIALVNDTMVDHLRSIIISSYNQSEELSEGGSYNFLTSPDAEPFFTLTYNGRGYVNRNLTTYSYISDQIILRTNQTDTSKVCVLSGAVLVTSQNETFSLLGNSSTDHFYIATRGYGNGTTDRLNCPRYAGQIMIERTDGYYSLRRQTPSITGSYIDVIYSSSGDGAYSGGGVIRIKNERGRVSGLARAYANFTIEISENAGGNRTDYIKVFALNDFGSIRFDVTSFDSGTGYDSFTYKYAGPVDRGAELLDASFAPISERGTLMMSLEPHDVEVAVAEEVATTSWSIDG